MQKHACVFFLLFLFIAFSDKIYACTCVEHDVPVCAEFDRADAVFVGKIERVAPFSESLLNKRQIILQPSENSSMSIDDSQNIIFPSVNSISTFDGSGLIVMQVKLERAFKGVQGKTVNVVTYQGTSCDVGQIKKGQRWIFYAYRNEQGILGIGACSRTTELSGSLSEYADYFSELAELGKSDRGTFVKGTLVKDTFVDERQPAVVSIEGENFFSSTSTNTDGNFSFKVPKAGKYKVRATVPFSAAFGFTYEFTNYRKNFPTETETVFEYEVDAEENKCNYYQVQAYPIDLKATARISGKFIPKDWSFFPKFYPRLCRLEETEEKTLKTCRLNYSLKKDGSFEVEGLREGKYTLVINEDNLPDGSEPFWRHYYPGVKDFSAAEPINLEQGQNLSGIEFKLPSFLPRREIHGRVFWEDGKPVTFIPDSDNELRLYLRDSSKPDKLILMDSFIVNWDEEKGEEIKMTNVNPDGTFSVLAFDTLTYWIKADIDLPNGKTKCGFSKVEFSDKTVQPIRIILNRTGKCSVEKYIEELDKKSK